MMLIMQILAAHIWTVRCMADRARAKTEDAGGIIVPSLNYRYPLGTWAAATS